MQSMAIQTCGRLWSRASAITCLGLHTFLDLTLCLTNRCWRQSAFSRIGQTSHLFDSSIPRVSIKCGETSSQWPEARDSSASVNMGTLVCTAPLMNEASSLLQHLSASLGSAASSRVFVWRSLVCRAPTQNSQNVPIYAMFN